MSSGKNDEMFAEQIAVIPIDEKIYVILRPVWKIEGRDSLFKGEMMVFEFEEINEEDRVVVVDDDAIIQQVFGEYYELLKEEEEKQ